MCRSQSRRSQKKSGQTLLSDTEQRKIYFTFSVPQKIFGLQMKHEDLTSCSDSRDYPVHEFRLGAAPPARLERKSLPVLRSCHHVCLPVPPPALPLCVVVGSFVSAAHLSLPEESRH